MKNYRKIDFCMVSHITEHLSFTVTIQVLFATLISFKVIYLKRIFSSFVYSIWTNGTYYSPTYHNQKLKFTLDFPLSLTLHIQSNHQVLQTSLPNISIIRSSLSNSTALLLASIMPHLDNHDTFLIISLFLGLRHPLHPSYYCQENLSKMHISLCHIHGCLQNTIQIPSQCI